MPDEVMTQTETVTELEKPAADPTVKADEFDKDRAMATIEKLREFEKQSKKLEKRLAEYEDAERKRQEAELSETDRLKKQLAEKEAALTELAHRSLQREVAEKVGLPAVFADRIRGGDAEEMEADAKIILEALPKAGQPKVGTTNPGSNATGQGETDAQKLARIHGQGVNMLNPSVATQHGGGVFATTKTE